MSSRVSQDQHLATLSHVSRVKGLPGDSYEVVFVNQAGLPIVPLTQWYHLRQDRGPKSTRETYLTHLQPFLTFLEEQACPWNAPPEQLRPLLIAFHRDRLKCHIHPGEDGESMEIVSTRETPLRPSTLRVLRAALRDFYLVLKEDGLYVFANPLSSEVLIALRQEYTRSVANRGAPDHAGIRGETWEQSRRRPTAFLRHPTAQEWRPELRKELADVREGIHKVLDALLDSQKVSLREKAVLTLLQNTGARLHEIVTLSVGGYRNEGIAGQARVINKGSLGCEIKTIYFGHNPKVQQVLTTYIEQIRPLYDPLRRTKFSELGDHEPLFLTKRGTPYSVKSFYWHWYKHSTPLQTLCPVPFSVHDVRHLFVTEFLIKLKIACGGGTDHFDSEQYLREREAFGCQIMGWRSPKTIDIYDQSRDGERTLSVLARYQQDLSERRSITAFPNMPEQPTLCQQSTSPIMTGPSINQEKETVWLHDAETMAWIKKMQQQ
jgi:integrase